MEGGEQQTNDFAPVQNQVYGFEHGGSARENAMKYQMKNDEAQNKLNQQLGGSRYKKYRGFLKKSLMGLRPYRSNDIEKQSTKDCLVINRLKRGKGRFMSRRRRFFNYGGQAQPPPAGTEVEVPGFAPSGPQVGPMTNNVLSAGANQSLMNARVAGMGDNDLQTGGRRRKTKRTHKRKTHRKSKKSKRSLKKRK